MEYYVYQNNEVKLMVNARSGSVLGYKEMKVPYEIKSKTDKPKGLAIMLAGMGYTVKSAVFHYSTGLFLMKNYDVLHVNYEYHTEAYEGFSYEEGVCAVKFDVKTVLNELLNEQKYEDYYLVGKSFGTLAINTALENELLQQAKVIWLTPLIHRKEVVDAMLSKNNKGLCIIGDKDQFYDEDLINLLKQNKNIEYLILPDVNHHLEYDHNVLDSISVLKTVTDKINQF
jgi:hypothetical protein